MNTIVYIHTDGMPDRWSNDQLSINQIVRLYGFDSTISNCLWLLCVVSVCLLFVSNQNRSLLYILYGVCLLARRSENRKACHWSWSVMNLNRWSVEIAICKIANFIRVAGVSSNNTIKITHCIKPHKKLQRRWPPVSSESDGANQFETIDSDTDPLWLRPHFQ